MRLNHVSFKRENGFTLIEMAIVLVIIGVMVASGSALYTQYRFQKDWENTQDRIEDVVRDIEAFYTTYGRYPCPASATAAPGDAEYGIEKANCTPSAAGTCEDGVCTYSNFDGSQTIMEGAVPFKSMNLQEKQTLDGYSGRFTYAVTTLMTDSQTFVPGAGAISVEDGNNNSMVSPAHSAEFMVISHGRDKSGARSLSGVQGGICGGLDGENCNGDRLFISKEIDTDFDDLVYFNVKPLPTEWKSDNDNEEISLKNTDKIIIGAIASDNPDDFEAVTLKRRPTEDNEGNGNLLVDNRVYAEELCEDGVENCFQPRLIAGRLETDADGNLHDADHDGSGMSCYDPARDPGDRMHYIQAIRGGDLDCTDEIVLECPDGQFITSVVDGVVRCDVLQQNCPATEVTTFCGYTETIPESAPREYQSVYTGECRFITDYDEAHFETTTAGMTFEQIENYLDTINDQDRDVRSCGNTRETGLVRDSYRCMNNGWQTLPTHEKLYPWHNFTNNLHTNNSVDRAENYYNGNDSSNNNSGHDCWCREDYRIIPALCPDEENYDGFHIQKHPCPQTVHYWETVYTNYDACVCTAEPVTEEMSCNAYYDQVNGTSGTWGLSGNVTLTYNVTCIDNVPVQDDNYSSADTSACGCYDDDPHESRQYCPSGETNLWQNLQGNWEEGVASITRTPWVCPGSGSGGLPSPGYWDWSNSQTETATDPCACDPGQVSYVTRSCPDGEEGGGITYEVPYNCNIGAPEPDEDLWTQVENDCHGCIWQAEGAGESNSVALGVQRGNNCYCGSPNQPLCYQVAGSGDYNIWGNCSCTVQD